MNVFYLSMLCNVNGEFLLMDGKSFVYYFYFMSDYFRFKNVLDRVIELC